MRSANAGKELWAFPRAGTGNASPTAYQAKNRQRAHCGCGGRYLGRVAVGCGWAGHGPMSLI